MLAGLVGGVACLIIYGLAPTGLLFLIGIPIGAVWGLTGPAVQSLMTREVAASEHGRLQGAVMSLASLAGVFSPFILASIFAAAIGPYTHYGMPGAAFVAAAFILFAGLLLAARVTRPARQR